MKRSPWIIVLSLAAACDGPLTEGVPEARSLTTCAEEVRPPAQPAASAPADFALDPRRPPVALWLSAADDPSWAQLVLVEPVRGRVLAVYEGTPAATGDLLPRAAAELEPWLDAPGPLYSDRASLSVTLPARPAPGSGVEDVIGGWLVGAARALEQPIDGCDSDVTACPADGVLPAVEDLDAWEPSVAFDAGLGIARPVTVVLHDRSRPDLLQIFVVDADAQRVRRYLSGKRDGAIALVLDRVAKTQAEAGRPDPVLAGEPDFTHGMVAVKIGPGPLPEPDGPVGGPGAARLAHFALRHALRAASAAQACGF